LVADRRADQVRAIRVEAFLHEQVDLAEVDDAEVDRELLGFADACAELALRRACHLSTVYMTSIWMVLTHGDARLARYDSSAVLSARCQPRRPAHRRFRGVADTSPTS